MAINFDKKIVFRPGFPVVPIHSYRREMKKINELVDSGEWGREVFLSDVISVEVFRFSEIEWRNLRGAYVFNKYLKFSLVDGRQHYIPIAMHSKRQIKELIASVQEINLAIQIKN